MKRSNSEPNLSASNSSIKRPKQNEIPDTKEYLQLALTRILEMQRQMKEDSPFDNTSDLGDSENEEDVMKEVLMRVFKDLPGSSQSTISIIEKAMKPADPRINAIRSKSIQLAGYDTCRRVALDFMKNTVKSRSNVHINRNESQNELQNIPVPTDYETNFHARPFPMDSATNYEIRMRMLKSLDLHLAVKQRDYVARLMKQ